MLHLVSISCAPAVKPHIHRQVQKSDRTTRTRTRTSPGWINSDLPGSTRTELKFPQMSFFFFFFFFLHMFYMFAPRAK